MQTSIQELNREKIERVFFVTLTVPHDKLQPAGPQASAAWAVFEDQRRAYFERWRRQWGERAVVYWKKEPQPDSGMPHIHALVFWLSAPPHWAEFIAWNDVAWTEVISARAGSPACNVKWLNGWGGVAFYQAKYCSKLIEGDEAEMVGRCWGIFNRAARPADLETKNYPPAVGFKVVRVLRKLQEKKRRRWESWSVLKKRWFKITPAKWLTSGLQKVRCESMAQQVEWLRSFEIPCRFRKKKVQRRRDVKIWIEVEERDHRGKEVRRVERGEDEKESFTSSRHFVSSNEVDRLVALVQRNEAEREKAESYLPI